MNTQLLTTTDYDDEYEDDTDVEPSITVTIDYDSDVDSPLEWMDDLKMYSFHRRNGNAHPNDFFTHIGSHGYEVDGPSIGLRRKLDCGTAVILSCHEHSNVRWALQGEGTRCMFDTADVAGILIWEGKPNDIGKTYDERMRFFRSILGEYNEWANGEVYWYNIEDTTGNIDDSCGGMYYDYLLDELRRILKDIDPDEIRYKGDAKWIGQYI